MVKKIAFADFQNSTQLADEINLASGPFFMSTPQGHEVVIMSKKVYENDMAQLLSAVENNQLDFHHQDIRLDGFTSLAIIRERAKMLDIMQIAFVEHEMIYDDQGHPQDYRYLYVNRSFEELTGWKKENIVGQLASVVYPPVERERLQRYQQLFEKDITLSFENYFPLKDVWYMIKSYKSGPQRFVSIFQDITILKRTIASLEYKNKHDPVTGIINYFGLVDVLKERKSHINSALDICINVRHFYRINSFYGFSVGDEIIRQIANNLQMITTQLDCEFILSHYWGDEFHLMLLNINPHDEQKYVSLVEANTIHEHQIKDFQVQLKKDIGYALFPEDTADLLQVVSLSNLAMKESTRNDISHSYKFTTKMIDVLESDLKLSHKLHQAIIDKELYSVFQNIYDARHHSVMFMEALARWEDKDWGFIPPLTFLSIAKRSGLGDIVDAYLIEDALQRFARVKINKENKDVKLSINMMSSSFLSINFFELMQKLTVKYQLKPADVIIEISENTFINNLDICEQYIQRYKHAGFLIAIDDFGSEYSSLNVLEKVDYDIIKLDQAFTKNMGNPYNSIVVDMVVDIAQLKNKLLVAEGVETLEDSQQLITHGCFVHQGFYYHRPSKM